MQAYAQQQLMCEQQQAMQAQPMAKQQPQQPTIHQQQQDTKAMYDLGDLYMPSKTEPSSPGLRSEQFPELKKLDPQTLRMIPDYEISTNILTGEDDNRSESQRQPGTRYIQPRPRFAPPPKHDSPLAEKEAFAARWNLDTPPIRPAFTDTASPKRKRGRPTKKEVEERSARLQAEGTRHEAEQRLSKKSPDSSEDAPTSPNLLPTKERAADLAVEEATDLAVEEATDLVAGDLVGPKELVPEQGAEGADTALRNQPKLTQDYGHRPHEPPGTTLPAVLTRADASASVETVAKPEQVEMSEFRVQPPTRMPYYSTWNPEDTSMNPNQLPPNSGNSFLRRHLPKIANRRLVTTSLVDLRDILHAYTLLEGPGLARAFATDA